MAGTRAVLVDGRGGLLEGLFKGLLQGLAAWLDGQGAEGKDEGDRRSRDPQRLPRSREAKNQNAKAHPGYSSNGARSMPVLRPRPLVASAMAVAGC
jgi:hypothetical protein